MALDGQGARVGPGMPGAPARPPGWRRGCTRPPRTARTARSRRSATTRPHQAGPVRSRHGGLPRPAPRTGAWCCVGRGRWSRAGTARVVPPRAAGRPGWPRTSSARPRRGGGTPRRGRYCPAGAGAQARSPARRGQRRGRARRAGPGGRSCCPQGPAASWQAYPDGRAEPPIAGRPYQQMPVGRAAQRRRPLVTLRRCPMSCVTHVNRLGRYAADDDCPADCDIQNRLFWRVGTGRAFECCVPSAGWSRHQASRDGQRCDR